MRRGIVVAALGTAQTLAWGFTYCLPAIDARGGRGMLALSNLVFAAGLVLLAVIHGLVMPTLAWTVVGVGMAMGLLGGAGALAAVLVAAPVMPAEFVKSAGTASRRLLDFRPVFRNRAAMGWIAGYTVHTWELAALRAWGVTFLAATIARNGAPAWLPDPTLLFTIMRRISRHRGNCRSGSRPARPLLENQPGRAALRPNPPSAAILPGF